MTPGLLLQRFITEEASLELADMILGILCQRTSGVEYLTFNVFNLRLDFDMQTALIEDELDPDAEEGLSLDSLKAALESYRSEHG